MAKLRAIYMNFKFILAHKEAIKKRNNILNEEIKKENDNFEKDKQQIIDEKMKK